MARVVPGRDISLILAAAQKWIADCLVGDGSVFSELSLWKLALVNELKAAFSDNLDEGPGSFSEKLTKQLQQASPDARKLMSEIHWALALFPTTTKPKTKREEILSIWRLSGTALSTDHPMLADVILQGIGSAGTAYNTHKWREVGYLISLLLSLKSMDREKRLQIFNSYERLVEWVDSVPRQGSRQFRHMLRYFAFPDKVERMSSDREHRRILSAFGVGGADIDDWNDRQLDEALFSLRQKLEAEYPSIPLDFYAPPLSERWARDDETRQQKLMAVYVGRGSEGNLAHALQRGIWGFKEKARPENLDQLRHGDIILFATGYEGNIRMPLVEWRNGKVVDFTYATISGSAFKDDSIEWNDEANIPPDERYFWRIRFDAGTVQTRSSVSLDNESAVSEQLADALRKSAIANGRGNIIDASAFSSTGDTGTTESEERPRFWVEKTLVRGRPDREFGDHAKGRALWSPQESNGGADIYRLMREVAPGDIVFHFVDNENLDGYSTAASAVDTTFVGLPGTEWADRPAYRVPLRDNTPLVPVINRKEFLENPSYQPLLRELLEDENGVFFNRGFNLNQGSYLTEAPLKLVQIWNDIHFRKTGRPISNAWDIPPLNGDHIVTQPLIFDSAACSQCFESVTATRFRISEQFLQRFVLSLLAKPFLILTGNSGTGKTRLAELFARWLSANSRQFAVVPVGADWSDNRNVLGYVNHLRSSKGVASDQQVERPIYQSTKILDLLLEASRKENAARPFFLILDEMNLSHVERYFADFLSALESKEATIQLHREGASLARSPLAPHDVPESVSLPRNLFVIGTVNIDESTYMFSPKVLDRANVIEFRMGADPTELSANSGNLSLTEIGSSAPGLAEGFLALSLRARNLNSPVLDLMANARESEKDGIEQCNTAIADLFLLMQKRHLEFAYRTIAEMHRYLALSYELTPTNEDWRWQEAMDAQILQKILPKVHGSKRKIGPVLSALAHYCENGDRGAAEVLLTDESKSEAYLAAENSRSKSPRFQNSFVKLCDMMNAVRRDQFVSFIQ